jgi:uncharacterized protein
MTPAALPLPAVRAVALHTQGLTTRPTTEAEPTLDVLHSVVERMGCVQIDTVHVVRRSHYLTLWSRVGAYDPAALDTLAYDPAERRLFEYWQHAASLIPLEHYRYRLHKMQWLREGSGWWPEWGQDPDNLALADAVLARIRDEGPLRAADFKSDGTQRGAWWDWKPAKRALEFLFDRGELMIAERVNFQRVYDLRERVLPAWVDTTLPTLDETRQFEVEQAARALGLAEAGHIADYAYLKRGTAYPVIERLLEADVLVEVACEVASGETDTLLAHRDTIPLLEWATEEMLPAERTTFLSPFDNLFWGKGRDELLWDFRQVLEAYKPAAQREWGYFCLPILWHDQLVGRMDPKLDRDTGVLHIQALYLHVALDDQLVHAIAAALRDFMAWHGATDLVIDRSDPPHFAARLLAVL